MTQYMRTTSKIAPQWNHWDEEDGARQYHGKEITLAAGPKNFGSVTTYKHDFPAPKLYWKHQPPKNKAPAPVSAFGCTTSYREAYQPWGLSSAVAPVLSAPPVPKFKPKLSTQTTARESYKTPARGPARPSMSQPTFTPNDAPMGTTTMRADYQEWKNMRPTDPIQASIGQPSTRETKFTGTTTTREGYQWPTLVAGPKASPQRSAYTGSSPFDGNTEYRARYGKLTLPEGMAASLGVQVATKAYKAGGVGGQFEMMIPQGANAPTTVVKHFTTVKDDQSQTAIVVIAKREGMAHGVELGTFTMENIKAAPVGHPKVEVTYRLSDEKTLHVSALYRQGNRVKALTFHEKNMPLRRVAEMTDLPRDMFE